MAKTGANTLMVPHGYVGGTRNIQLGSTGLSAEQSKSQTMTAIVFNCLQLNNYFLSLPSK